MVTHGNAFHDYVMYDLLRNIEGISSRPMFGSYGLYKEGTIFGIIADEQLFFKADRFTDFYFKDEGSAQFTYEANGRTVLMPYWQLPERVMDDNDELRLWIDRSVAVTRKAGREITKEEIVVNEPVVPLQPVAGFLFDFYGVLCQSKRRAWFESTIPHIETMWPLIVWLNRLADVGQISFSDYVSRVAKVVHMSEAEVKNGLERAAVINEDVEKLLQLLRPRYPLALLTNSSHELTERILRRLNIGHHFNEIFISSQIGLIKPQPELYLYSAAKLGLVPEGIVLIDDSAVNVTGARAVGMQGVVFTTVPDLMRDLAAMGVNFS
ncbi:MAG: HAD-IA family hydrolase [Patescibacteria group bacterium]